MITIELNPKTFFDGRSISTYMRVGPCYMYKYPHKDFMRHYYLHEGRIYSFRIESGKLISAEQLLGEFTWRPILFKDIKKILNQ